VVFAQVAFGDERKTKGQNLHPSRNLPNFFIDAQIE